MVTERDVHQEASDRGLSSLATTYQTVKNTPEPTCGIAEPRYIIDLDSGDCWPARCRRNKCEHCLPMNARRRALAITYMQPQRMVRLSLVAPAGAADPMTVARTRVKRCRAALLALGADPGRWCWTMEVNPAGTGYHAHILQAGGYIDQRTLQTAAVRAGAGIPYINVIRTAGNRTARYGLKTFGAAGYGLKTYRMQDQAFEALALNHGRLEHHTPGFFNLDGEKAGVRDVERQAIKDLYPGRDPAFLICDRESAEYYLSPIGRDYRPRSAAGYAAHRASAGTRPEHVGV